MTLLSIILNVAHTGVSKNQGPCARSQTLKQVGSCCKDPKCLWKQPYNQYYPCRIPSQGVILQCTILSSSKLYYAIRYYTGFLTMAQMLGAGLDGILRSVALAGLKADES